MERGRLSREAGFHAWLQWLASSQLAAAQDAARAAGMDIGVIQDMAVGAHPGGADAWSDQDLFVSGVTAGMMLAAQDKTPPAKHSCKGKNDCKGTGGCSTGDQGCKGKNTCKGKGGCATDGSTPPKAV